MYKKLIEIEKIPFNLSADNLFRRVLYLINRTNLWPKALDYENRSITVAGNVKAKKTNDILKKTNFGGKLGAILVLPWTSFSKIIIFDRLKIKILHETPDSAIILLYGRIGKFINERIYSKKYDANYEQLRDSLINSYGMPEDIENIIADIREKIDRKKIIMPYLSFPLFGIFFILLESVLMLLVIRGYFGNWGGYLFAAIATAGAIIFIYKIVRSLFP